MLAMASCVVALGAGLTEAGVASADTSLQPSDTLVREGLFVAGGLVQLENDSAGVRDRVVETVLQRMYQNDPTLDPKSAESSVAAMETAVSGVSDGLLATQAPNEQILELLATLQQANLGAEAETAVGGVADDAMTGSVAGLPSGQYIASADSLATLALTSFSPTTVLAKSFELAEQNADFATVRDAEWGAASGEQLGMTVAQLEATPTVKDNATLLSEVKTMQSGTTVEAATTDENDAVSTVQSELGDAIGQLNDPNRTQELPPEITAVDNASQSSAFDEVTIDDGTSSFDAQTGLNVFNGMLNGFFSGLASGGEIDPAALAASVVTGGLTSLMPTLESVLGLGGAESADQEILDQIHQLSVQIANFEQATAQNFQIVDQALSEILTQDSVLASKLSQVGANVASIASQLAGQEVKIDQLQADVYGVAADQDSEQLNTELNTYIGYQQQSGGQPLGQSDFLTAAGDFYTASTSALDPIALGPTYNFPSDLYTRMTNYPLAMNVDYLSQVAKSLTGTALDTSQVPNPDDWAVAARAYSELLLENPALVTSSQLNRLQQIASEGQELMTAVASATNDDATTGTDSTLFNALLARYGAALTSTEQEIAKVENEYESSLTGPDSSGNQTPLADASGQPLDLTKNASQLTSDYETVDSKAISTLSPCTQPTIQPGDPHYGVSMTDEKLPANVLAANAPDLKYWELADRLGLGTLKPCWEAYLPATLVGPPDDNSSYWDYDAGVEWQYTPAATKADPTPAEETVYKSTLDLHIYWGNGDLWGVVAWCWNEDASSAPYDCFSMGVPGYPDPGFSFPLSTMLPDPTETATADQLKAIKDQDNEQLAYLREQMVQSVVGDGTDPVLEKDGNLSHTGALGTAADALTGDRDLLNSYAEFALGPALQADSALRSLIEGADQLPGENEMQAAFDGVETNGTLGDPLAALNTAEATNDTSLTSELAALISGSGSSPGAADHALLGSDDLFDSTFNRLALTPPALAAGGSGSGGTGSGGTGSGGTGSGGTGSGGTGSGGTGSGGTGSGGTGSGGTGSGGTGSGGSGSGGSGSGPGPGTSHPTTTVVSVSKVGLLKSTFTSKRGTTLHYTLTAPARVTATLTRTVKGHRKGNRCLRSGHGKTCQLVIVVKKIKFSGHAGTNSVAFGRGLAKGTYTLTIVATVAGSAGKKVVLHLKVR